MLKKIAYTILILFGLSLFGSLVKYIHSGNDVGFVTKPLIFFTSLNDLLEPAAKEMTTWAPQFQKTPKKFSKINKLEKDVIILYSKSVNSFKRQIVLKNLKTDSIEYTWDIDYLFERNDRLFHPLLIGNKEIVFHIAGKGKILMKIDSLGKILFQSKDAFIPHHSLNLDENGDVWSPGKSINKTNNITQSQQYSLPNGKKVIFRDNYIQKWDIESGTLEYNKSLAQIFIDNGLEQKIRKANFDSGPFHTNDIQPVIKTTKYFKQGDLFISIRNMSMIIHFRPQNNKVIKVIEGPFSYQHDIDIKSDSTITFFNNNTTNKEKFSGKRLALNEEMQSINVANSQIIEYNYSSNAFDTLFDNTLKKHKIFTHYEGLHHWLPNGNLLIEEQEKGILWIVTDSSVVYKNVLPSKYKGYHQMLNWTRVFDSR